MALIIAIALAPAFAQANFTIENAKLTWASQDITHVNPNANPPITAILEFSYEANEVQEAILDLTELNTDIRYSQGLESYRFGSSNCALSNNTVQCFSAPFGLKPEISQPNIIIKTINSQEVNQQKSISLSLHEQDIEVTQFTINDCESDECFISSNVNADVKIRLDNSPAGYNRANIYYQIGDTNSYVGRCEGANCQGESRISCTNGETLRASVIDTPSRIASRDDAGNRVTQYRSPVTYTCDNEPPIISNITIKTLEGRERISVLDPMLLELIIEDQYSDEFEIVIDNGDEATENITATCQADCTLELPSAENRGRYDLTITVTDKAGNTITTSEELNVLGIDEGVPDFWEVQDIDLSTDIVNKDNLIFARDVYGSATLSANENVELFDVERAGTCTPSPNYTNRGEEGDIAEYKILQYDEDSNRIFFKFTIPSTTREEDGRFFNVNRLTFECPIDIYSSNQEYIFTLPEQKNVTINIGLEDGQNVGDEIRKRIERADRSIERYENFLQKFNVVKSTVGTLCEVNARTKDIAAVQSAVSLAVGTANVVTGGMLSDADIDSQRAHKYAEESKEKIQNVLDSTCQVWACDASLPPFDTINEAYTGFWDSTPLIGADTAAGDTLSNTFGMDSMSQVLNPYSSPIIALAQGCAPAIAHHTEVYLGIQCAYNECLSHGTVNLGQTVSICNEQKSRSQCMFWSEAISQSIPLNAFVTDAMQKVSNLMKDPVAFFGFGASALCGSLTGSDDFADYIEPATGVSLVTGPCGMLINFRQIQETAGAVQRLTEPLSVLISGGSDNQCSRVRNLKDPQTHAWNLADDPQYEAPGEYNPEFGCTDGLCPTSRPGLYIKVDNPGDYFDEESGFQGTDEIGGAIQLYQRQEGGGSYEYLGSYDDINRGSSGTNSRENDDGWNFNNILDEDGETTEVGEEIQRRGMSSVSQTEVREGVAAYLISRENMKQEFISSYPDDDVGKSQWNIIERQRRLETREEIDDLSDLQSTLGELEDAQNKLVFLQAQLLNEGPMGNYRGPRNQERLQNEINELEQEIQREEESLQDSLSEINNAFRDDTGNKFTQEEIAEILDDEDRDLNTELTERLSKEYADVEKATKQAQRLSAHFGGYANTMRTAWGTAGAVTALRSTFGVDTFFYENGWLGISPQFLDDAADFLSKDFAGMCDTKKPLRDTSSGVTSAARSSGITGIAPGLTIGARKITQETPDGPKYTYYIVGGGQSDSEGLRYTVELDGQDLTMEIFGKEELESGEIFGGEDTALLQEVAQNYQQICANLERTSNLNNHFSTNIDNNRLCANIIEEGNRLT